MNTTTYTLKDILNMTLVGNERFIMSNEKDVPDDKYTEEYKYLALALGNMIDMNGEEYFKSLLDNLPVGKFNSDFWEAYTKSQDFLNVRTLLELHREKEDK